MEKEISFEELDAMTIKTRKSKAVLKLKVAEPVQINIKEVQARKNVDKNGEKPIVCLIIDEVNGAQPATGTVEFKTKSSRLIRLMKDQNLKEMAGKTFSIGFTARDTGAKDWGFNPV